MTFPRRLTEPDQLTRILDYVVTTMRGNYLNAEVPLTREVNCFIVSYARILPHIALTLCTLSARTAGRAGF
jgi:hypothetical protein